MTTLTHIRILYIEDDPGAARLLQKHLTRAGYEVDLACDGMEGLAKFKAGAYDVLAVDHDMPQMTGLELIRRLADSGPLPLTVMITGAGNETIAVEAMKLGASDYIIKDSACRYLELVPSVIEKALEKKHLYEEKVRSWEELQRLVHQLQVHQAELETQNEELRLAQEQLAESRDRYLDLYDFAPVGYLTLNEEGLILEANLTAANLLGSARGALIGRPFSRFVCRDRQDNYFLHRQQVFYAQTRHTCEIRLIKTDGTEFPAQMESDIVPNATDKPRQCRTVISDVTERKKGEKALREISDTLSALVENMPDVVHFKDGKRRHLLVNRAFEEFTGLDRKEVIGKEAEQFLPPDLAEQSRVSDEEVIRTLRPSVDEQVVVKPGPETVIHETRKFPIVNEDGRLVAIGGISRDITDRKRTEEQTKASLIEKEMLLREIHHRVKNNLAQISSLISLQYHYSVDRPMEQILEEIQTRIRSMALIHELLHKAEGVSHFDVGDYVTGLVEHLMVAHGKLGSHIKLDKDIEKIPFALDTTIPLGFLLTELVSNCLKHAFPEGGEGEIAVALHSVDEGRFELVVKDNGIGMPKTIDIETPDSMGLDLIDTFVEQIRGRMTVKQNGGTEFRIIFGEVEEKSREA
ncbi:PAS domain S-box protein [Thermodesulfobacteriota bacterium]